MADEQPHDALERAKARGLWLWGFLRSCLTRFSSHGGANAAALTGCNVSHSCNANLIICATGLAVFDDDRRDARSENPRNEANRGVDGFLETQHV